MYVIQFLKGLNMGLLKCSFKKLIFHIYTNHRVIAHNVRGMSNSEVE
jgi:hypothetical protein